MVKSSKKTQEAGADSHENVWLRLHEKILVFLEFLWIVNWFATVTLNTFRTQTTKTIHFKTINGKHVFFITYYFV